MNKKRLFNVVATCYIAFSFLAAATSTRVLPTPMADNQEARAVLAQSDGSPEARTGMVYTAISKSARITIYTTPQCFGCEQLKREIPTLIATGTPVEIVNAKDSPPEDKTIDSFPTIIIYDGDIEIKRIVGYTPAADILAFLPQEVEDPDYKIYKH